MTIRRCVAAAAVCSAMSLVGGAVEMVSAGIQPSCAQVNNGDFNGFGSSIDFRGPWIAGNTIIVHSGEPSEAPMGGSPPSTTQLLINGVLVDSGGFPATLQYTFPADADYTVLYSVNDAQSNATFTVTCTEEPPPTTSTTTTTSPTTTTTSPGSTTTAASTPTSAGSTTTTAVSPITGVATTAARPSNAGALPATGRSGTGRTMGIAVLALVGGALALTIARRRTS
jgi:hypothetical protein